MVASALAQGLPMEEARRTPNAAVIGLISLAGAAAATCSLDLALRITASRPRRSNRSERCSRNGAPGVDGAPARLDIAS